MRRTLCGLVLLVCVVYVTSQSATRCPPACAEPTTVCCLKPNGASDIGRCSPKLPRNARCRTSETIQNGVYLYDCPCLDDLDCVSGRCTARPVTTTTTTTPAPGPGPAPPAES